MMLSVQDARSAGRHQSYLGKHIFFRGEEQQCQFEYEKGM